MKKLTLILSILFCCSFAKAQFFTCLDGAFVYPVGKFSSQVDYGYGPALSVGYTFNKKFDVSGSYEKLFFSTIQPEYSIKSESVTLKYRFINKKIIPFLGVRTGLYHSERHYPSLAPEFSHISLVKYENAFGISPIAGILFDSGIIEKLKFTISASYSIVNFTESYEYAAMNIGLRYNF